MSSLQENNDPSGMTVLHALGQAPPDRQATILDICQGCPLSEHSKDLDFEAYVLKEGEATRAPSKWNGDEKPEQAWIQRGNVKRFLSCTTSCFDSGICSGL
jgi:hypothetical protein